MSAETSLRLSVGMLIWTRPLHKRVTLTLKFRKDLGWYGILLESGATIRRTAKRPLEKEGKNDGYVHFPCDNT